ncbi:NERD domain-containing protein [Virgibacillus kekensis]|uniref:NERD domain-containing protein n=1 Tax=Virgibacillus kekensis TaxID=202261 RepID=A0ABV9DG19_9BACI
MAQLIKLQDYISRYEWNIYRYPSQYIRMKQDQWKKLHQVWLHQDKEESVEHSEDSSSAFDKFKSFIKRNNDHTEELDNENEQPSLPESEDRLRHYFLDKLFPLQLKWASSTVTNVSFTDRSYYQDETLKFFLQRFPDTYLLMYYPIFNIKKAPIDGEIILISPVGIEIIYLIEANAHAKIVADEERTWLIKDEDKETKILSPMIALKRTDQIIRSILHTLNVDFPVKKVVLSRKNIIEFHTEPYNTKIIGKHAYEKWFNEKRNLVSPLKNTQLKAAEALLKNCQTTAVKRPEWEEDTTNFSMDYEAD